MSQIASYILLFLFLASQYITGWFITRFLIGDTNTLFARIAAYVTGVTVSVPVTYVLSVLFVPNGRPILWGTSAFSAITCICFVLHLFRRNTKNNFQKIRTDYSLLFFAAFAFVFSYWIMTKTFHGGSVGELFVGSNNVFDFGHATGILRSFSWGDNIPLMSPFRAGLPFFYHFFFLYWVSIWEYFGVPLVWAMNIPSILSFFSLLVMVYYLPQRVFKLGRLVGWITVILTITHSTLTFWHLLAQKGLNAEFLRFIWRLPTYPYAGPFDGSMISIFTTLNNYVNQRHLAFAVAVGLLLVMVIVHVLEGKNINVLKTALLGSLTGFLFLWNMAICAAVFVSITLYLSLMKKWKLLTIFFLGTGVVVVLSVFPFLSKWKDVLWLLTDISLQKNVSANGVSHVWDGLGYLWENLGFLPGIAAFGFMVIPKKRRIFATPLLLLFILECMYAVQNGRGFDQKFFSFFIIGANMTAAVGIAWLWQQKHMGLRALTFVVFFILTVSGAVDLMAIKNEFAYPLIDTQTARFIAWIHDNTPKWSVFVSYPDIIDPVVLAGRKNYIGFFANTSLGDRAKAVSDIYAGDASVARANGVSHVLVPKWKKSDFSYVVHEETLRANMTTVFESERYIILSVN